ncbi:hypothetical protein CONCODRAFT_2739, partial [Conidiobolus coronatus NRRL 28638]
NWFDFTSSLFDLQQTLNSSSELEFNSQLITNWLLLTFEQNKFIDSLSLNKVNKLVQLSVPIILEFIDKWSESNVGGYDRNSKKFLGDRLRLLDLILLSWGQPCLKYQQEILTTVLTLMDQIKLSSPELTSTNLHIIRYCFNLTATFCQRYGSKLDPVLVDKLVTQNLSITLNYLHSSSSNGVGGIGGLPNLDNLIDKGNSLTTKLSTDKFIKSSLRSLLPALKYKKSKLANSELELILSLAHQCSFWGLITLNEWKAYQIKAHSNLIQVRVSSLEEYKKFLYSTSSSRDYLSESDWLTSSSESNVKSIKVSIKEIRQFSIKLIKIIFEKRKDQFIHYLKDLLPSTNPHTNLSLIYLLINDPSAQSKLLLVEVLEYLLSIIQNYLSVAISSRENSSFTSFSEQIGNQLILLHNILLILLQNPSYTSIKTNIFKCLKLLLTNCNYNKLKVELILDCLKVGVKLIETESTEYQIIGFNLIELTLQSNIKQEILFDYFNQKLINSKNLIEFSLLGISNSSKLCTQVKVNICKLIPNLLKFKWINWDQIQPLITELMDHEDPQIRVEAFRILIPLLENSNLESSDYTESLNDSIFDQYLPMATCDNNPLVKAIAAELLSYYPQDVFEALDEPIKFYSITILIGWAHSNNYEISADVFKTLGVWISFPTLLQNEALILDLIQINLDSRANDNLLVRVKSSWCLANICDKLVELKENSSSEDYYLLHNTNDNKWGEVLSNIVDCGVEYCKDHDKIKGNGVRILGRIGKLLTSSLIENNLINLENLMDSLFLCFCSGLVKTRWNSILSIGQLYNNPDIIELTKSLPWHKELLDKMFSTLIQSHNYKFKTHIITAFQSILPYLTLDYLKFTQLELVKLTNLLGMARSGVSSVEFGHWNGMLKQIEELQATINTLIETNSYKSMLLTNFNPISNVGEIEVKDISDELSINLNKLKLD